MPESPVIYAMEYNEAIEWLYNQLPMFSRMGAAAYKPGLERSVRLAEFFGNPHQKFKSIHVGGTNGKGSVSNLIAAVLQSQGYKVGLYTSPHLVDFRERIRINGEMIPEDDVTGFVETWLTKNYDGDRPSFFELTMIMAFDWFASQKVDYAVIEVGMGGRLDSTNIITPLLSIITNISKDHTQFLGDTLEKIALEKAGIIKKGVPTVIGEAVPETEAVFRRRSKDIGARIREAYREIDTTKNLKLNCALRGDYQEKNVNTARIAIDEMRNLGIYITDENIRRGFSEICSLTGFMGRWTILSEKPLVICDTGHNEAGLTYNLSQLQKLKSEKPESKLHFVIGFVADKDIDSILGLFPNDAQYYLTQARIPRALPYQELRTRFFNSQKSSETIESVLKEFDSYGNNNILSFATVEEALETAKENARDEDIIFIGGSTFIVADALKAL